jgi:uncharacterized membrane protein
MKSPRGKASPEPPAGGEWPVTALAAAGLVVSSYLAWTKWTGASALFCESGSGCDVIQASRYAMFLGAPTAAWGVVVYALLIGLAVAGLTPRRWTAAYALAVGGVAFSAYLTYLALWELRAACPWCLADAGIAAALLATLLLRRPARAGRRARPGRLVAIGAPVALATVVFAAGVFVTGQPTGATAEQEGLARHLAASGVIFYGAYW